MGRTVAGEPGPGASQEGSVIAIAGRGARAREFVSVLRRRGWILGACAVFIPAAVYVIVAVQPTQQRATVILQPSRLAPESLVVSPDVPAVWFQPSSASFVALLVDTLPVRIEAAQLVHRSPSALGSVDAVPDKKTGWITVSVTAASGRSAVDTANAMATAVARNLQLRTRKAIASLQAGVEDQLAQTQGAPERRVLTAQLQRFKRFRPDRQQTIQVIQPAVESRSVSNAPGVAAALSLAFALLVGSWLVRFAERADRSMHRPEDLELAAGAPLLAAIPSGQPASAEPFLRLRDAIVYLGGQGSGSTLIVTSPMGDEGRTSVAMGLANAYVAAGRSVILVDADLRNPQIASRSGLPPGVGLADVLIGGDLEAALQADDGATGTGLTILPAGSPGPDSPDLLASARMT
ncbi:MAG: tyrosine-protein kinase, partial [Frankiales bacterium]|nr:tyrosine-protein kinase [Frankiales bacterium]